jgi:alpha-galactosidase
MNLVFWKRVLLAAGSAACMGAVAAAQSQESISGYWDLRLPVGDGTFHEVFFALHQRGQHVNGYELADGSKRLPLTGSLRIAGSGKTELSLVVSPARGTQHATVYRGTWQDGKLTLVHQKDQDTVVNGEATRCSRSAALPPAPLPLPQAHSLPDNGLARTPPMGWNSWNRFAGSITDADIRAMADAMVATGMRSAGYQYINIDDTWEMGRNASGNMVANNKFPDMKALAEYVHSKDLKIGIYSSPGAKTCGGYAGSFGHEVQDARTYAAWGFDYLKYDYCGARDIYPLTKASQRGLFQAMGEALESTGRPIVYSLSQSGQFAQWTWGAEVGANLWRTTPDIQDNWRSMERNGFSQLALTAYSQPGHWNDPDMLEIGNGGMNAEEYRTQMSLWSLLSAPLLAGNDLRSMTAETQSILMNLEVIAVDQDPAARPAQLLTQQGKVETLWRPMGDGSIVVGIFNRGESAVQATLPINLLPDGFSDSRCKIRDLWQHREVSLTGGSFRSFVPAHGVNLLRIARNRP